MEIVHSNLSKFVLRDNILEIDKSTLSISTPATSTAKKSFQGRRTQKYSLYGFQYRDDCVGIFITSLFFCGMSLS